jgi:2-oxoglutarate dehydrogenase E2 component (dihydrolipoamide succinyltransferase)
MPTEVTVPEMGESISEAVILRWIKADGEQVAADEPICELETDKATFDLPAPAAGALKTTKEVGATVRVGESIARIDKASAGSAAAKPAPAKPAQARPAPAKPAAKSAIQEESPDSVAPESPAPAEPKPAAVAAEPPPLKPTERTSPPPAKPVSAKPAPPKPAPLKPTREPVGRGNGSGVGFQPAHEETSPAESKPAPQEGTRREPMTKIRRRIAERLVRAQHTAAMLTTFNEIDMTEVLELRELHKEQFEKEHGVSLGLMSFFSRACVLALKQFPAINAEIDGTDIVYHDHVHLAVAVSTDRGLVVPVIRHVEHLSFAQIESEIKRVATAAREGKLSLQELSGGTFTITNGGVFGSLLSTPILNPPQTGILGMHIIQKRPIVINDKIRARRMMYVALSYDHRLIDGRDAVQFLVKLKKLVEDPMAMLLEG